MRKIDPVSTALCWNQVLYRKKYSVPGPNALWHIDEHQKLIRWRLVMLMPWEVVAFLIRTLKVMYMHYISFSFQELIERSER